jgi:hypothetical protein
MSGCCIERATANRGVTNQPVKSHKVRQVMKSLRSQIEINASAQRVWEVLTDAAAYPEWNPFIPQLAGRFRSGEKLEVRLAPPGGIAMTFRPQVLTAEPMRELRWLGHLVVPGLFDGEHRFSLETLDANRIRFTQEETFTGILVSLFIRSFGQQTLAGFEAMNLALKQRAESLGAPPS